jgi:hypothetical protein
LLGVLGEGPVLVIPLSGAADSDAAQNLLSVFFLLLLLLLLRVRGPYRVVATLGWSSWPTPSSDCRQA